MSSRGGAGAAGPRLGAGDALGATDFARAGTEPGDIGATALRRLLRANTRGRLRTLLATTDKLLCNAAEHPDEPRYRSIKTSNKTIAARVLGDNKGGRELLRWAGFRRVTRDREEYLTLDAAEGKEFDAEVVISRLGTARHFVNAEQEWLAIHESETGAGAGDDAHVCEALVQVRLEDGRTAMGGFGALEPLHAVVNFAADYTRAFPEHSAVGSGSTDDVVLALPFPPRTEFADDAALATTLAELDLVPRGALVVSKTAKSGARGEFRDRADLEDARERALAEERAAAKAKADAIAAKKVADRRAEQEAHERALKAFADDRIDATMRSERVVAATAAKPAERPRGKLLAPGSTAARAGAGAGAGAGAPSGVVGGRGAPGRVGAVRGGKGGANGRAGR